MDIRKFIREEVERMLQEQDVADDSLFGGAIGNIEAELEKDLTNVSAIINTQQIDMKNRDNEIKANLQLKSKLDSKNPHRKGLESQLPEDQKDFELRKKQLKDLQNAQLGLTSAQKEIQKNKLEMEKQAKQSTSQSASTGQKTIPSVLPSLQSPI